MKKYTFLILGAVLVFTSCEDFFATTLKVDPPVHQERLAVHLYINQGDTVLFASVRSTVGLLENPNKLTEVNDATVELYSGTQKVCEFAYKPELDFQFYNYYVELGAAIETFGTDLELRVTHPNYETVTASDVLPKENNPSSIKYIPNAGLDEDGEPAAGLEITINDPSGVENFYELTILAVNSIGPDQNVYPLYASSIDPSTSNGSGYEELLVSDVTFDGSTKVLLVTFAKWQEEDAEVVLRWNSITRAQYLYSKSIRAFSDSQDGGPFAEPVSIFSNMENGLGIFGLRTTNYIEVVK